MCPSCRIIKTLNDQKSLEQMSVVEFSDLFVKKEKP
jgi:hypothetical protein